MWGWNNSNKCKPHSIWMSGWRIDFFTLGTYFNQLSFCSSNNFEGGGLAWHLMRHLYKWTLLEVVCWYGSKQLPALLVWLWSVSKDIVSWWEPLFQNLHRCLWYAKPAVRYHNRKKRWLFSHYCLYLKVISSMWQITYSDGCSSYFSTPSRHPKYFLTCLISWELIWLSAPGISISNAPSRRGAN